MAAHLPHGSPGGKFRSVSDGTTSGTALSDVRRDRVEKVDDYARFGIRWYWIVDPALRTFEVWELRDGAYAREGAAGTGEVTEIPGCPGLVLDLDALWAKVDALP